MKTVELSAQTVQEVVDFLKTRPYEEVFQLIHKVLNEANQPRQQPEDEEVNDE